MKQKPDHRERVKQAALVIGMIILAGVVILLLEWLGLDIRAWGTTFA